MQIIITCRSLIQIRRSKKKQVWLFPRSFKEQGEEAFRKLETQCLEKLLRTTDGAVISVGGGLPLREENRELLKKLGLVVYLDVSPETVYKRIGADVSSRPMLHSDDVPGRIRSLLNERRPLY